MTAPAAQVAPQPYRERKRCRVCDTVLPAPYLDLGNQPLANGLVPPDAGAEEVAYPLAVAFCASCGLSQLTVTVDPSILFRGDYKFQSGVSRAWHAHCEALAREVVADQRRGFVIDIAANDGTQLSYFEQQGWEVLGVEPSDVPSSIPTIRDFWSATVASGILAKHGSVDLVIAQNVFGHVDDPVGFLRNVRLVLGDAGRCVIEVPNVGDLIANMAFDTVYHEHLSYWSASAIENCAARAGMVVDHVDRLPDTHGGSLRVWLRRGKMFGFGRPELFSEAPYRTFGQTVIRQLDRVVQALREIQTGDVVIGAFGASAKGNVMLNALKARGNTVWPTCVVDETPSKQGFLTPGTHIPIVTPAEAVMESWDVCWILSWNWAEEIKRKARGYGFKGTFLVTSPALHTEDS